MILQGILLRLIGHKYLAKRIFNNVLFVGGSFAPPDWNPEMARLLVNSGANTDGIDLSWMN